MKLIQITDTHLLPPGERLPVLDPRARLEVAVADIATQHADAALCVVTGDLVSRGDEPAYSVLRACLAPLPMPVRLLVGNHDDRANLLRVFPETALDPHGFVQSHVVLDGEHVLLLDTLAPGHNWGAYCAQRLAWLDAELAAAGDAPVYVFLHHPPFRSGIPALDAMGLRDGEALGDVLARHGNVRHLFTGHLHRSIAGSWRGIPISTVRSTIHQFRLDLEEPERIGKLLEAPAYGLILIEDDSVLVHLHEFLGAPGF